MGYLKNLYETYENAVTCNVATGEKGDMLIPVGCITQNAQVEVTIDEEGTFITASEVPKTEAVTITPSTIKSAARTSSPVPHPLFDNLWYVAGDLEKYFTPTSKRQAPYEKNYRPYMKQLKEWADRGNPFVEAIYRYLEKKTLVEDLISVGVLKVEEGKLTDEKVEGIIQNKAFVRFAVVQEGVRHELWKDGKFMEAYGDDYAKKLGEEEKGLCYITGKEAYITELHGKYIRNPGDGAKLISSNDKQYFTFRGRFDEAMESAQVSYEVSEKAHAALRWLIQRQGYTRNGLVVLAWNNGNREVPQPMDSTEDTFHLLEEFLEEVGDEEGDHGMDTGEGFARRLNLAIGGYKADLSGGDRVSIISLDAATPGRLSVLYYREFSGEDYLSRIEYWHRTASWPQWIKVEEKKYLRLIGAPALYDIVRYAYGTERNDFMDLHEKIATFQMKRLLPCIVEKKRIPTDLVINLVRNASRPMARNGFNWQRTLDIACGIMRKYNIERKGVDYAMTLNKEERNRSYLYGRLLAVAERIESHYNYLKNIDRPTNAKRYMEAFSKRPFRVWKQIYERILPYLTSLPGKTRYYFEQQIDEIMNLFEEGDYSSYKGLDGNYLLGYSHQLAEMSKKKEIEENK